MLADYNMEICEQMPRGDGIRHVDTPATIARLHVTTYFYLDTFDLDLIPMVYATKMSVAE